jgi:hypothetical protein
MSAVTPNPTPGSTLEVDNANLDVVADENAAAEAEQEAVGNKLDELARKFELNVETESKEDIDTKRNLESKTRTKEELALRKSCLVDDMRKAVIQLEHDWEDTYKDTGADCYLDEIRATLMTEATFDLVRHKEEVLVKEADEKGLTAFDPSLKTDEFFGKTARSLERIESERRKSTPGYLFLAACLSDQDISTQRYSDDHEFLVHYLHESGLEHVSPSDLALVLTSLLETNWMLESQKATRKGLQYANIRWGIRCAFPNLRLPRYLGTCFDEHYLRR